MENDEPIQKEYKKLNFIGNSGNGKEYIAKSKTDNKTVVIKEYSKHQVNSQPLYENELKYKNQNQKIKLNI